MTEEKKVTGGAPRAENRMGTAPVHGLLLKMSLPVMASMMIQSLYNVVDSIFVSRINQDALTAVSYCFPIQSLMIAFAIGTSVGMGALVSRFLGAKDFERVNKIVANGMFLMACTYVLFFVFAASAHSFMGVQTGADRIVEYGTTYLRIVCGLSPALLATVYFERLLQSTGKTKFIFFTQGLGAIINIILDPILIFGLLGAPRLGVAGAAYATVFGQACGAALGIFFNFRYNHEITINMKGFRPEGRIIRDIYGIGLPSIIMQSVGSVMVFGLNQILGAFTDTAVAAFGAYFKLQSFVFMPIFGLNNGVVPIIAYNYGAANRGRMLEAKKIATRYAVGYMTFGLILFWLIPDVLMGFFDASPEMLEIGRSCLRILSLAFPLAGYSIMQGSVFQALGKSIYSMYTSIVRQLVVLLPVAYVFSKMGVLNYVWFSFPIAEIVGLAMTIVFVRNIHRDIIDRI